MIQAISYLLYLLLARPDLHVAQGLLSSDKTVTFLFGIGGEGIRQFNVEWDDRDFNKLLYAFIYRLYEPGDFADSSYTHTKVDEKFMARYTIKITDHGHTKECHGFYSLYARNPFTTHTHVLSNPTFKLGDDDLTVLKDQLCRGKCFEELEILKEHVHSPKWVPGVMVAAHGENFKSLSGGGRGVQHCRVRTHSATWQNEVACSLSQNSFSFPANFANRMDSQFHHHVTGVMILISIM